MFFLNLTTKAVFFKVFLKDQISRFILREFKRINFNYPWNHQKTVVFLMISEEIEVNLFAQICLILEAQFGDDPLRKAVICIWNKVFIRAYEKNYFSINPYVKNVHVNLRKHELGYKEIFRAAMLETPLI